MSSQQQLPSKFLFSSIGLATAGIGVSFYSITHHLKLKQEGVTDAACNINQTISCDTVAASAYSELFGLPLGAYGLAYFLSIFLLGMVVWKSDKNRETNLNAMAILSFIGALVSVVLASISTFAIGALCLTCIAVYVLTGALAVMAFSFIRKDTTQFSLQGSFNGLTTAAIITASVLVGYSQMSPGSDPTTHPNYVQEKSESAPTLSTKSFDIPVNMSAYSGFGEDYRKGSDQAKVTIVEFADMECPACSRVSTTMNDLAKKYGSKISIVFKNYPLDNNCNDSMNREFHKHACKLAVLARCAGEKGKFWEYHNLAFQNQRDLAEGVPEKWARTIGLAKDEIKTCLSNKGIVDKIKDDVRLGNQLGVQGTPSIYINGKKYLANPDFYSLSMEIEKILAN